MSNPTAYVLLEDGTRFDGEACGASDPARPAVGEVVFTTGMAGYQLLDLHDYLGQGTALIGILDTFWESKGYVSPQEFAHFAGPTVLLARMNDYAYRPSDKLQIPVEVAHFGEAPIAGAHPEWRRA